MIRRLNKRSLWTQVVCAMSFAIAAVLTLVPSGTSAIASDYHAGGVAAVRDGARFLPLGIGKSVVIDLPREIKDVLVADPKIANAVVRSAQRAYIIGAAVGQTNIFFFDSDGQQIAAYDIAVTRDLNGIRAALKHTLPNADINIEGLGDGVVLTGVVTSPVDAQQAGELATRLVGGADKVVNSIVVRGRDQVMLKVTVAEVQRDVIKQLGIDLNGAMNFGTSVVNFNNVNPFSVVGQALVANNQIAGTFAKGANGTGVTATLRAMERAGVVRTLAEPNLTAISGESASFVAGGEFPLPKGLLCSNDTIFGRTCQIQVDFKKFGITLNFTPVVLTEGRISLRVMTEVSELSSDNSLTLDQGGGHILTVPSIKARRAETTLEIPSGGSLAMAGMIHEQTKQALNGLPGLMQLPVLGALFKSRDYVNRQTELMVLVTPYVVRAVAQKDLSRPDDGFVDASDPSTVITGALNRIYGVPARVEAARPRNVFGFITD
ncbi:type II and III secretion system protein family protein [Bradyrhizobium sp. LHD-71]|uniref:type II and III secretion system protein family protein n=1 Tax=Bradyrhizobium sp. LHD-71 TaxID=3072141 RepID=UPI00280DC44A|nr:type II and III secretion system protein family protein [Bradyrhizobium sp. LHD-71]MDQ8727012.1 type II and III secretion system protein family protein [Bradyrhizobium sp. LHD-71]